jgi:hypothetical protein
LLRKVFVVKEGDATGAMIAAMKLTSSSTSFSLKEKERCFNKIPSAISSMSTIMQFQTIMNPSI